MTVDVLAALEAHVLHATFPCLGGQTSVRRGKCEVEQYEDLASNDAALGRLASNLSAFVQRESVPRSSFSVHVAVDPTSEVTSEKAFDAYLWDVLAGLHRVDTADWDPRYSKCPNDPSFKFSFAGRAFYVVGLSPAASRTARRFQFPALVFNPVWQFERLREIGQLDRLIEKIRVRDELLQGSINPNLEFESILTDALQYSGMAVDPTWQCPVSAFGTEDP